MTRPKLEEAYRLAVEFVEAAQQMSDGGEGITLTIGLCFWAQESEQRNRDLADLRTTCQSAFSLIQAMEELLQPDAAELQNFYELALVARTEEARIEALEQLRQGPPVKRESKPIEEEAMIA